MDLPYASGWSLCLDSEYILSHFLVLIIEETYLLRAVPSENYSKALYDKVQPWASSANHMQGPAALVRLRSELLRYVVGRNTRV